jgi:hypothetical protein
MFTVRYVEYVADEPSHLLVKEYYARRSSSCSYRRRWSAFSSVQAGKQQERAAPLLYASAGSTAGNTDREPLLSLGELKEARASVIMTFLTVSRYRYGAERAHPSE